MRTNLCNLTSLVVLAAILPTIGPDASAQSRVGTTIGQFLRIEPSARHAGMGNAGAGLDEGIAAVYEKRTPRFKGR